MKKGITKKIGNSKTTNSEAGSATTIPIKNDKIELSHLMELTEEQYDELFEKEYKFYGITVCPCSNSWKQRTQDNPQLLADFAIQMATKNNATVAELHFEYKEEKKNGRYPHVHFTALKKSTNFRFYTYGLSIKIVPIYNFSGWKSYCLKDEIYAQPVNPENGIDDDYPFI